MENLIQVKVRDTDDYLYVVKNTPSKFIEGDEYVTVKRFPTDKEVKLVKKKSISYHWR